jgi:pathogenesis-related protein 1
MRPILTKAALLAVTLLLPLAGLPESDPRLPDEFLKEHNRIRAKLGILPLMWSERMAAFAKEWALTLVVRSQFNHSEGRYGENLYEMRGGKSSPARVVEAWASEVADYDYHGNRCRAGAQCGHYTQIVWRGTTLLGCGVARSSFREVWVCEYFPPGNVVGQRPY